MSCRLGRLLGRLGALPELSCSADLQEVLGAPGAPRIVPQERLQRRALRKHTTDATTWGFIVASVSGRLRSLWERSRGRLGVHLELQWAISGPCWVVLGASQAALGLSWAVLRRLGALSSRLGILLGGLLGHLGAIFWAVVPSWTLHGPQSR
eukprot:2453551-Pyramimonas_sp.AAC.1